MVWALFPQAAGDRVVFWRRELCPEDWDSLVGAEVTWGEGKDNGHHSTVTVETGSEWKVSGSKLWGELWWRPELWQAGWLSGNQMPTSEHRSQVQSHSTQSRALGVRGLGQGGKRALGRVSFRCREKWPLTSHPARNVCANRWPSAQGWGSASPSCWPWAPPGSQTPPFPDFCWPRSLSKLLGPCSPVSHPTHLAPALTGALDGDLTDLELPSPPFFFSLFSISDWFRLLLLLPELWTHCLFFPFPPPPTMSLTAAHQSIALHLPHPHFLKLCN